MINLIPIHARKHVKTEYWIRVCSVWLLLLSAALIVVGTLMVPSLVLIRTQLTTYGDVYQTANEQNNFYKDLEKKVNSANTVSAQLVDLDNGSPFTQLTTDIENISKGLVTVEAISLGITNGRIESVKVTGNAFSRATLVEFRDALEEHSSFESVELPLSNLAKDKDVPFSIIISTSDKEK